MERFFKYSLTVLFSIVSVLVFVQVVARYVFQLPIMGLDEIMVYPTLWLYWLGSVSASREDTQIKANVLDVFLKTDSAKQKIRIIADVTSFIVALWLTWWTYQYFLYAFRIWKGSPTLYIPMFYAESSMFIGMLFMTLYAGIYLVKNVRLLVDGTSKNEGVEA